MNEIVHLVLMVGSNPLPNCITAMILQPSRITFVFTPETESVYRALREVLAGQLSLDSASSDGTIALSAAGDPHDVFLKCSAFFEGQDIASMHLNYTGGTKVMAVQSRRAFERHGGRIDQCSYLDERKQALVFDSGQVISMHESSIGLTRDILFRLHSISEISTRVTRRCGPTAKDTEEIASACFRDPTLPHCLYVQGRSRGKISKAEPFYLHGLQLSVPRIPEKDWTKADYEPWLKFLTGCWLEEWVYNQVRTFDPSIKICSGVSCKMPGGTTAEFDVLAIIRHRLYLISCTTQVKKADCKLKLFEVAMRGRQLGGDLARTAVVCMLHGGDGQGLFIDQINRELAFSWDSPNLPKVFGLEDLRAWNDSDNPNRFESLKNWFNE